MYRWTGPSQSTSTPPHPGQGDELTWPRVGARARAEAAVGVRGALPGLLARRWAPRAAAPRAVQPLRVLLDVAERCPRRHGTSGACTHRVGEDAEHARDDASPAPGGFPRRRDSLRQGVTTGPHSWRGPPPAGRLREGCRRCPSTRRDPLATGAAAAEVGCRRAAAEGQRRRRTGSADPRRRLAHRPRRPATGHTDEPADLDPAPLQQGCRRRRRQPGGRRRGLGQGRADGPRPPEPVAAAALRPCAA